MIYATLAIAFVIVNPKSQIVNEKCQGDHGRYGANYRCCLPALAGFVSPHSMGPDGNNFAPACRRLQGESFVFIWWSSGWLLMSQRLNGTAHGFDAELFHPGLGNEVVKGKIFIEPGALIFQSDAASISIPAEQLVVELGQDDGRIYFRRRTSPGLRIYTSDESILNARGPGGSGTIRDHLERMATRREIVRRLRITAYVFGACVLWAGSACLPRTSW